MAEVQTTAPMTSNHPVLIREEEAGIVRLTMNRPDARNALSEAMLEALGHEIADIAASPEARVVILSANGPVFCAGHDIREMQSHRNDSDGGKEFFEEMFSACSGVMQSIVACPKPVIAAVEGTATAAGCQLVATCDLAVAGEDVSFCTPGVHIGLFCSTPAVAVARNVGRKRAMEMLLLGEMIAARDAYDFGLVNRVVPAGDVLQVANEMAETIAAKSMAANAIGKRAFYEQIKAPLDEAYTCASKAMVENMMMHDAQEGLDAFLNKRNPEWRDA